MKKTLSILLSVTLILTLLLPMAAFATGTEAAANGSLVIKRDGDALYARTTFDDEYDLVQKFSGMNSPVIDVNKPFDWASAGLIPKTQEALTGYSRTLASTNDDAAPFWICRYLYIGANHGVSAGLLVTTSGAHGKTYEDLGSVWSSKGTSQTTDWILIRIVGENQLMFLSEKSNSNEDLTYYDYSSYFNTTLPSGHNNKLTYKTDDATNFAKNTADITISSASSYNQHVKSIKKSKQELDAYAYIDGEEIAVTDGDTIECDYIKIVEKYDIKSPLGITKYMKQNRPEGGYTGPVDIAFDELKTLVEYNMEYFIYPDGTVISSFDHYIPYKIRFNYYGAIQAQPRNDAMFGADAKKLRYIPNLKIEKTVKGVERVYDYTHGVSCDTSDTGAETVPPPVSGDPDYQYGHVEYIKDYWIDETKVPDRTIDTFYDTNDVPQISYAMGYLPLYDGANDIRKEKTNTAGFIVSSQKTYPHFVDSKFAGSDTTGKSIRGVAYKKYNDIKDTDISYYTIPFENEKYLYIDVSKALTETKSVPLGELAGKQLVLVDQTDNISYSVSNDSVDFTMKQGTDYGYLVLKTSAQTGDVELSELSADKETGAVSVKVTNNTQETTAVDVIVAGYKSGKLVEIKSMTVTLDKGAEKTQSFSLTAGANDTVKAFAWNAKGGLTPICEALTE